MTPIICHVAETLRGGTASYLDEILPRQVREIGEGRVHLLGPDAHLQDLRAHSGVVFHRFRHDGRRARHVLRLAHRYLKLRSRIRPDIVHVHGTFAGVAIRAAHAASLGRAPVVYCAHGWAFDRDVAPWKQSAAALVERVLSPLCDATVCISNHDRESALRRGLPARSLHTVRNAIGLAPQTDAVAQWPSNSRRRVLFVGRFDRQKGVDVLLQAMQHLEGRADAWLAGSTVVSDGMHPSWPGNVSCTGWLDRTRLQAFYESCDLVVVPSRWEGFGLVALEAMRAGKPVVATRVGGLPELVEHGQTGLLIEPDDPVALASAIQSPTSEALRAMGEEGRLKWRSDFSVERLDRELMALYADVLMRRQRPSAPALPSVDP